MVKITLSGAAATEGGPGGHLLLLHRPTCHPLDLSKVSLYILSFRFYFRSFIFILDELQVKHRLIICWREPRKKLGSSVVRPNTPRPAGLRLLVCESVSIFGRYEIRKFQTCAL